VRAESTGLSFVCRCSGDTTLNYGVGVLYGAVRCSGRGTVSVKRDGNMWASRTTGKGFARQARLATHRSPRLTRTERARASAAARFDFPFIASSTGIQGIQTPINLSRNEYGNSEFRHPSTCRERNSRNSRIQTPINLSNGAIGQDSDTHGRGQTYFQFIWVSVKHAAENRLSLRSQRLSRAGEYSARS
jgi:hypothetical protein